MSLIVRTLGPVVDLFGDLGNHQIKCAQKCPAACYDEIPKIMAVPMVFPRDCDDMPSTILIVMMKYPYCWHGWFWDWSEARCGEGSSLTPRWYGPGDSEEAEARPTWDLVTSNDWLVGWFESCFLLTILMWSPPAIIPKK